MADNYLEKKFEEHLNAPYKPTRRKTSAPKLRRVVVTGGAKGIGRVIVRSLRVAAHKVAFCDIDDEAGRETAMSTGADYFHVDVTDVVALRSFFSLLEEKWGGVDAIVNNVTVKQKANILDVTPEQFDLAMATDVRPILIGAQEMARMRGKSPSAGELCYGRIVNICSSCQRQSMPGNDVHAAAKGAVFSLTHSLAISLSPWHIAVNSISPGKVLPSTESCAAGSQLPPSGRVGRPEDVARLVRFLLDDASDFINAENFVIDGGMTRKMIPNQ
ncbi:MAG: SDR family NAD(P)-dependent oxidoreductase [Marinilabiliaceae bacterium]